MYLDFVSAYNCEGSKIHNLGHVVAVVPNLSDDDIPDLIDSDFGPHVLFALTQRQRTHGDGPQVLFAF